MAEKEIMKYGILTGIVGAVLPIALPFVSKALSTGGFLDVSLQSVASIKVTGLSGVVNTGLSKYAAMLLNVLPGGLANINWLMLFLGGFGFGVIGYFGLQLVEKALKITSPTMKLATVFITASFLVDWILTMSLGLPGWATIITTALTAVILAFLVQTAQYLLGVETRF